MSDQRTNPPLTLTERQAAELVLMALHFFRFRDSVPDHAEVLDWVRSKVREQGGGQT